MDLRRLLGLGIVESPAKVPETLQAFCEEVLASPSHFLSLDIKSLPVTAQLLNADSSHRKIVLMDVVRLSGSLHKTLSGRAMFANNDVERRLLFAAKSLYATLSRTPIDFGESDICELLRFAKLQPRSLGAISLSPIIGITERFVKQNGLTSSVAKSATAVLSALSNQAQTAAVRKLMDRLSRLGGDTGPTIQLALGEPWTDEAIDFIQGLNMPCAIAWCDLLTVASRVSTTTPSAKYLSNAPSLIDAVGKQDFTTQLQLWMITAGTKARRNSTNNGYEMGLDPDNANVLRGLIWAAASLGDSSWAAPIGDLAERCYKKLPWHGPRCAKVGNACVAALSVMTGDEPASQLARLRQRVKQPTGRKMTEKALGRFAERSGLSVDEIEERGVPTLGFNADGIRRDVFGDVTATTSLWSGADFAVEWLGPDAKPRKSMPANVKSEHADAWHELQAIHKQLKSTMPAQRHRLDQLFLQDRSWPFVAWREYYIEHPIVGSLARRLIWIVGDTPAFWTDGQLTDIDGRPISTDNDTSVSIWHPALRASDEVLAWRRRLQLLRITQPFKQAHREIYLLTDAERQTQTYSNRFAGHVLRQHQFAALCQQRGWTYRLQGGFDSGGGEPTIDLPRWNLRAEFWINADGGEEAMSASGIFVHVATDQVRFYDSARTLLPLDQIPPLVFSEILRDVDLFVGVASVGNDPTWQDGGPGGRFQTYWQNYSFGDLAATAQTRKAVLENLLPRLSKIHDRCSITDKFLVVRGDIRTYKIHLGSGNILMEPNDQYLCIVPDRSSARAQEGVLLPFEGDATLSIILSKAFLLAADTKITDPTIIRQIKG